MHIDAWIEEREKRKRAYRRCQKKVAARLAGYERTHDRVVLSFLFRAIRAMDAAYLRWCETDRWPVEYDEVKK